MVHCLIVVAMDPQAPEGHPEPCDGRGVGGKAERSKPRSTPGKLFSFFASPLTAAVRSVSIGS